MSSRCAATYGMKVTPKIRIAVNIAWYCPVTKAITAFTAISAWKR